MLTDGGEIHEEIESEPCAAQESNNQIPQISNHIGGPSWSPSSGKEFSFSSIAQHKCGSIYFSIVKLFCWRNSNVCFAKFLEPNFPVVEPPGACQPIFKVAMSLQKCVFWDKF